MANGCKRDHRQQEDDGQSGQQDVQRDFVRGLLPLCAFDQRDHAIEKGFAGIRGDLHVDLIGEHARAAGYRRAIAAGFANHRRRFAGDGRFVHRSDAFDDLAVGGNEFAGGDNNNISRPQLGAGNLLDLGRPRARRLATVSERALRSVSACALPRPSAMASAKFANSTVNHSQSVICRLNTNAPPPRTSSTVVITLPISTTNMTGLPIMWRGSSLTNESRMARETIFGSQIALFLGSRASAQIAPSSPAR